MKILHQTMGLAVAALCAGQVLAFDGWRLEDATVVGGKGASWDYVSLDQERGRLYIGHRSLGLQVYDLASRKLIKTIDGTPKASSNGATLMPEFDLGLSNNENGTLTPFKMSTMEAMAPIALGEELDASHYDPGTKRVVVNMAANKDGTTDLVVLQMPGMQLVGKINVATTKPEHSESDGKGNFYLAARDVDKVFRLDLKTLKVTATWPTPGCGQTNGLAVDATTDRLFLGCRGRGENKPMFAVMNASNGEVVYKSEIGGGNDGVVFDHELKRIFLPNSVNAVLNVFEQVNADTYKPVEALGTRAGVRTIAMDSKTKKIYAVTTEGSADYAKKITTSVSPYYANTFFNDTFTVLTFSKGQ
jgi:hypothetical protein